MPYLTGELPAEVCLVQISIQNDDNLRRAVRGAISELIYTYNWEESGSATPEECAEAMIDALDTFTVICPPHLLDSNDDHLTDSNDDRLLAE